MNPKNLTTSKKNLRLELLQLGAIQQSRVQYRSGCSGSSVSRGPTTEQATTAAPDTAHWHLLQTGLCPHTVLCVQPVSCVPCSHSATIIWHQGTQPQNTAWRFVATLGRFIGVVANIVQNKSEIGEEM